MRKKLFVFVFSFLFFSVAANAQLSLDESLLDYFSFDLGGSMTVRVGHQGEYVFSPIANDRMISYLEWYERPLFIAGLVGGVEFKNLRLQLGANIAIPTDSGIMDDSDYDNLVFYPNCADSIAGIKTRYTESQCHTNSLYSFDVQLSYSFKLNSVFSLVPILAYSYQHSYQSAMGLDGFYYIAYLREDNGYMGWYYTEGRNEKIYESEDTEAVSLSRDYYTTWIGLGITFNLSRFLTLDVAASVSPFTAIKSLDSHFLTDSDYFDDMRSFFHGGKFSANLNYKINYHNNIFARVEFMSTGMADGVSYSGYHGSSNLTLDEGSHSGGDMKCWDFSLGYKYSF